VAKTADEIKASSNDTIKDVDFADSDPHYNPAIYSNFDIDNDLTYTEPHEVRTETSGDESEQIECDLGFRI